MDIKWLFYLRTTLLLTACVVGMFVTCAVTGVAMRIAEHGVDANFVFAILSIAVYVATAALYFGWRAYKSYTIGYFD